MRPEEPARVSEEKLGNILVKNRLITDNQLKTAFDYQRSLGGSLVDIVERLGFASGSELARFLSEENVAQDSSAMKRAAPKDADAGAVSVIPDVPAELATADSQPDGESDDPAAAVAKAREEASRETSQTDASDPLLLVLIDLLIQKGIIRRRDLDHALTVAEAKKKERSV